MIKLFKSLWRKLFPVTRALDSHDTDLRELNMRVALTSQWPVVQGQAYDPMLDEDKILKGEVESYFD